MITFNKYSTQGSLIFAFEEYKNPYTFYFCEAIVQLFTNKEKVSKELNDCINTIEEQKTKIIVGPSEFYENLVSEAQNTQIYDIKINASNELTKLNNKCYEENYVELNLLILKYESEGIANPVFKAFEDLRNKYRLYPPN